MKKVGNIVLGLLLGSLTGAMAALPTAPEGFIWQAAGLEQRQATVDLANAFTLTLDGFLVFGNNAGSENKAAVANFGGLSQGAAPSNGGALNLGSVYYDPVSSNSSIDFALTGTLAGTGFVDYSYAWEIRLSDSTGATYASSESGQLNIGFNRSQAVSGSLLLGNLTGDDTITLSDSIAVSPGTGATWFSSILSGGVSDFTGTLEFDQTYQTYVLQQVPMVAIPEPSTSMLVILSVAFFLIRSRSLHPTPAP